MTRKGYWIGRSDISNPEAYKAYIEANAPALRKYGAKFLVRGGRYTTLEGESRARNAVIEFPSYEAALACYNSPEYQEAAKLRKPHAVADIIIVEGHDQPDP